MKQHDTLDFPGDDYSITIRSEKIVREVQDSEEYRMNDSSAIFAMLQESIKPIDFSYYLKRYIYREAGFRQDFQSVSTDQYVDTIASAFENKGVPCSIKPTSTRPRNAIRNWLSQKTVSRETVIILGFGLEMNLEDVNGFLTKALQESTLNPKEPIETICWYCLKEHLGYYHFRRLISAYEALPGTTESSHNLSGRETTLLRTEVSDIRSEKALMAYLNQLRRIDGKSRQSVDARMIFDRLYDEAREIIASLNNEIEEKQNDIEVDRLRDELSRSDRLYDEQKQDRIRSRAGQRRNWSAEEITPVQFEEVLFSAVPRDRHGNLLPMKGSSLNEQFRGKRLNRQHLQEILSGTGQINRYDLATMNFFVLSQKGDQKDPVELYHGFVSSTNAILDRCGMGELYAANPYDAFLMICMLSDYPLGTYADVWEMSYESEE